MPLPDGFSEWEHLQTKIIQVHNTEVRRFFKNQADDDISTPKASLKQACLIKDDDSLGMVQLRLWLFEVNCGHTRSLQRPVYGKPVITVQEEAVFKPQVELHFYQDWDSVPDGFDPIDAEINIRIFGETNKSYNRTKAELLARKIKNEFASPTQFQFDKGKHIVCYWDKEYGYNLQIYAISKTEGEQVIKKVLAIQDHPFRAKNMSVSSPERNSVNNPIETELVYGRTRKERRWRPTYRVKFRWASLKIHGVDEDIILVDTTGFYRSAIERTYDNSSLLS